MNDEEKQLEEIKACLDKNPRLPPSPEQVRWLLARLAEKDREIARLTERRFPIQGGPSVPWSVIAPHESQCQKNHSQSLKRLADRGGLGPEEAYLVVTGRSYHELMMASEEQVKEFRQGWWTFAEKANLEQAWADRDRWKARAENLEGAYHEEQQWAIELKMALAQETLKLLSAHKAIKLALDTCPFPVGAMKAKRALEAALEDKT